MAEEKPDSGRPDLDRSGAEKPDVEKSGKGKSIMEFPCVFPIKAMGRASPDFESTVTTIVFSHAEPYAGEAVAVRESGEGNFQSVTVTVVATSREQLDRIYLDLTACDKVLMAL